MSKSRVVRLRTNLDKVVRQSLDSLGDTLQYSPPARSRRSRANEFKISFDVRVEEVNKAGTVVGSYEHHVRLAKRFTE